MSDFSCEVVRVEVEPHPDADRLEIAKVGGYKSIIQKGQFKSGDLAVYIPDQAVLPERVLKRLGLEGKLSGRNKDRVKAIRLRGVLSQGLLHPLIDDWKEGDDVTELLGITKYEPPVPQEMAGKVLSGVYSKWAFKYDFENFKKRVSLIEHGEEVVMTEKVHGTFMVIGVLPHSVAAEHGISRVFVASKRQFAKGITFDLDNAVLNNVYLRALSENNLAQKLVQFYGTEHENVIYLLGEVYGVQDLKYGLSGGKLGYAAFDIAEMTADGLLFLDEDPLEVALHAMDIPRVPVLYRGPFSQEIMELMTDGKETVSGNGVHVREGVVVKPALERFHPRYGRAIVKSVSADYLLRKNATEFN